MHDRIQPQLYFCCVLRANHQRRPAGGLVSESVMPITAPRPDETVTMSFSLKNVGTGSLQYRCHAAAGGRQHTERPATTGSFSRLIRCRTRLYVVGQYRRYITATFHLQDGAPIRNVTFTIRMADHTRRRRGIESGLLPFSTRPALAASPFVALSIDNQYRRLQRHDNR